MNHGYCKNCWWWYLIKGQSYEISQGKLVEHEAHGICLMHSSISFFYHIGGSSYCPDYCNRNRVNKRDKQTLEQWIQKMNIIIPEEEKVIKKSYGL